MNKLASRSRFAFWLDTPDLGTLEALAMNKVDIAVFDGEHGAFSNDTLWHFLGVSRAFGLTCFVRVPGIDRNQIGQMLDWGADAVIIPGVNYPEQVADAIDYATYPPGGVRGFGPRRVRTQRRASEDRASYFRDEGNERRIWAQIETVSAVEHIEAILAVPGLAGVLVGPMDLTGELGGFGGVDVGDTLESLIDRAVSAAIDSHIPVGVVEAGADPSILAHRVQQGCTIVSIGTQLKLIDQALSRRIAEIEASTSSSCRQVDRANG